MTRHGWPCRAAGATYGIGVAVRTNFDRKAPYVPDVEAAVEDCYRRIQIPEHTIQALHSLITAQFSQLHNRVMQERNVHVLECDDIQAE